MSSVLSLGLAGRAGPARCMVRRKRCDAARSPPLPRPSGREYRPRHVQGSGYFCLLAL